MSRTIEIDPVTRIEGHAKVFLEIGDDHKVVNAHLHVMEFRGFEKFVEGMQVELMSSLVTRICGTCPHAHHLAAAKTLDKIFQVTPPRSAILLRQLMNAGSIIHSHAIHFFLLAGPDLFFGVGSLALKRNVVGLVESAPDLAVKALRLRSIGQRISETVGGRGTHPVTAIAGGMSCGIDEATRKKLLEMAEEALSLSKELVAEGKKAIAKNKELVSSLKTPATNLATVNNGNLDCYQGTLRARRADGSLALEFSDEEYRKYLYEEADQHSYSKAVFLRDPLATGDSQGGKVPLRVGPLARLNCADSIDTPLAAAELAYFKSKVENPCNFITMGHFARLVELLHFAEKAVQIASDAEITSSNIRTPVSASPKSAVAHVESPRGVLIHDYQVDSSGYVKSANFIVATQLNLASINESIRNAAETFWEKPEEELLNTIEFAIRCYDPCLSCSTHHVGQMPMEVVISREGRELRRARR